MRLTAYRRCSAFVFVGFACALVAGCQTQTPSVPQAKDRLERLLRLYQVYVNEKGSGPPNEQALKDFGKSLTPEQRDQLLIGEDLENIFVSPRDNKKFEVKYGLKLSPAGGAQAVAWEAEGYEGRRYTALSIGYVEEYDEANFKEYQK